MDIGSLGSTESKLLVEFSRWFLALRLSFLPKSPPEVIEEAISLGAWGYVLKIQAEAESIGAVDAVFQGQAILQRWLKQYSR